MGPDFRRDDGYKVNGNLLARPRIHLDCEWLVGMGCASATHPYYSMPVGAGFITLAQDGSARIEVAAHDMGIATMQAQMTAELRLPLDKVTMAYGDTGWPAGRSRQR